MGRIVFPDEDDEIEDRDEDDGDEEELKKPPFKRRF